MQMYARCSMYLLQRQTGFLLSSPMRESYIKSALANPGDMKYCNIYIETEIDLVFSGHVHCGQFRLPFVGGLVAPNLGFFPEYDAGQFNEENTTMIVSRGVGNSIIPIRFNNRPEIVLVTLRNMK